MFKRLFHWILIGVAAGVFVTSTGHAGEVLERIKSRGYISLVGTVDWPPYSSLDENGNYLGFDVDVGNEVARRMGVDARRYKNIMDWVQETGGNWDGLIDISIGSMTPTAKRGENLDFPAFYAYGIASLVVHQDNTTIRTPADASGKRIGALEAAVYEHYLRRTPFDIEGMPPLVFKIDDPVVVTYELYEQAAFDALAKGDGVELDAVVNFLPTLMSVIRDGMPFRIIGQPLFRVPSAIAIELGDPELAAVLKEIIDEMHADGTLTDYSMKWFEFDMTKP
jgi:polar amino acid transport system substrate-binding protein